MLDKDESCGVCGCVNTAAAFPSRCKGCGQGSRRRMDYCTVCEEETRACWQDLSFTFMYERNTAVKKKAWNESSVLSLAGLDLGCPCRLTLSVSKTCALPKPLRSPRKVILP